VDLQFFIIYSFSYIIVGVSLVGKTPKWSVKARRIFRIKLRFNDYQNSFEEVTFT